MHNGPIDFLGREALRSREHIRRWVDAGKRGLAAAPKCEAVAWTTGWRCRNPAMREAAALGIMRCHKHLGGLERIEVDRRREPRLWRGAASENAMRREKAEAGLGNIIRRRLLEGWKVNPELGGTTLLLAESDEARVTAWLSTKGVFLDRALPGTGRPPTPRAIDRLRWLAVRRLAGRSDEKAASWELHKIEHHEGQWWRRRDALVAAGEPLPMPRWPTGGAVSSARMIVILPAHPAAQAKKNKNVAHLRHSRARSRIGKATVSVAEAATVDVPEFNTVYSKRWVEVMNHLRREFDLDRQPEEVADKIARAAWQFAHGAITPREWLKLRQSFAILTGKAMLTARPMATAMPAEAGCDGW